MLFHALLLLVHGEKAFAPAAAPGRMMPRAHSAISPEVAPMQRPMPQAVPPMQPVFEERSSTLMMASNVLFYSGLATIAAGAGMAMRRSSAASTETELTETLANAERGVARTVDPVMYDISHHDGIWSFEAKKEIFDKWDPEKPRTYENFNPFERNDEAQMCDSNGCFPGQSRGYKPPERPDVSWAIQQELNKEMDKLKALPKFNVTGKPGNFSKGWQDNLGAP